MKIKAFNVVIIIFLILILITNTIIITKLDKLDTNADVNFDTNKASVLHNDTDNMDDTKIMNENDNTSANSNDYEGDRESSTKQNNADDKQYIELSKDNAENYISISIIRELTGSKLYNLLGTKDTFANKLDFKCDVRGIMHNVKYEDVSITVKVMIKTTGYNYAEFSGNPRDRTDEFTTYPNNYEYEYSFKLLENGTTEDIAHDYIEFDDLYISEESLFIYYEIVDIGGQVCVES
ncbi:hypothetical protein [Butyrivibrio sp. M55]|uniref:hypothetical protein n=1 Tax=Butyrivibrio sp. M55 TaxID=1855323 RepID=UPI0008EC6FCF|nr:hypothetical protein [Butyrivibrio sp. M55]SFU94134.1 hypothetical protein SAMN05216540_12427 [Butyrivibrio sp. M55]